MRRRRGGTAALTGVSLAAHGVSCAATMDRGGGRALYAGMSVRKYPRADSDSEFGRECYHVGSRVGGKGKLDI